jgi:hypothetical protein
MIKVSTADVVINNQCHLLEVDLSHYTGQIEIVDTQTMVWLKNGKFHRIDGPAWIAKDGECHWIYNGKWSTPSDFFELLSDEEKFEVLWIINELNL